MDFVFTLHSHLPYVLNHGRWPHGSDWLCEAALDTYLPLLEVLRGLAADKCRPRSPSASPRCSPTSSPARLFVAEMEAFFEQRLKACDEAPASLASYRGQPPPSAGRILAQPPDPAARSVPQHRPGPDRCVPGTGGRRQDRDHRLGGHARLSPTPRARREHPTPAGRRGFGAPPHLRPRRPPGAGCRSVPTARGDPGSPGPRRHALACGGASRSIWPMPASSTSSWTPTSPPQDARSASPAIRPAIPSIHTAGAAGNTGRAAPLALPRVSRGPRPGGGLRARPPGLDAGLEPLRGLSRRRVVSRIPQDALARRAQALAGDRSRRGPGTEAALRSRKRRTTGRAGSRRPFRPSSAKDLGRARRRIARAWWSPHSTPSSSGTGGSRDRTSWATSTARSPGSGMAFTPRPAPGTFKSILPAPPSACRGAPGVPTATAACGSAIGPRGPGSGSGRWSRHSGTSRRPRWLSGRGSPGPGPGNARAAAGPVLRLAVHHLDRRGGRLCRAAHSGSTATTPSS